MTPAGGTDNNGKRLYAGDELSRMAALLADLKNRFIRSLSASPQGAGVVQGLQIEEMATHYVINARGTRRVGELPISN